MGCADNLRENAHMVTARCFMFNYGKLRNGPTDIAAERTPS
jgi:hypothetical protein